MPTWICAASSRVNPPLSTESARARARGGRARGAGRACSPIPGTTGRSVWERRLRRLRAFCAAQLRRPGWGARGGGRAAGARRKRGGSAAARGGPHQPCHRPRWRACSPARICAHEAQRSPGRPGSGSRDGGRGAGSRQALGEAPQRASRARGGAWRRAAVRGGLRGRGRSRARRAVRQSVIKASKRTNLPNWGIPGSYARDGTRAGLAAPSRGDRGGAYEYGRTRPACHSPSRRRWRSPRAPRGAWSAPESAQAEASVPTP